MTTREHKGCPDDDLTSADAEDEPALSIFLRAPFVSFVSFVVQSHSAYLDSYSEEGIMKPLVAIVGRPNVGKSTFFNRMIGEHLAIIEDIPGTTRDRIYGDAEWNGREFTLIDTGGLDIGAADDIMTRVRAQVELAIQEADVIVLMCDAHSGITSADNEIAAMLRRTNKPVVLVVNKADNTLQQQEAFEFYTLALDEPIAISSLQGKGTGDALDTIVAALPPEQDEEEQEDLLPRIAIVGRPNVGKSSLLNAILGEERAIVSEVPGTTRDTIDTVVRYGDRDLRLIDTAGIRRRGRIAPGIEHYSVLRAHRAIDRADVALLLIDAIEGLTAQDTHIAGYIHEAAKGVVVVVNKWDLIREKRSAVEHNEAGPFDEPPPDATGYRRIIAEGLKFIPYAPVVFAAAKTGYHVAPILDAALRIADERHKRVPTSKLNTVIHDALLRHSPPQRQGRQLRILYATQAEINPPTFVLFINDEALLHFSYERYLENQLRRAFGFEGTAIRLVFRARAPRDAAGRA
jgi:GTP-binding protein